MSHAGIIIYNGLNLLLWQRGGMRDVNFAENNKEPHHILDTVPYC